MLLKHDFKFNRTSITKSKFVLKHITKSYKAEVIQSLTQTLFNPLRQLYISSESTDQEVKELSERNLMVYTTGGWQTETRSVN